MSNIYKLQRFTGDAWVDVKIGQEIPTTVTNTSDQTEVVAQLEEYLTLSQISGQFLSTQLLAGNLSSHALYQMPNARAIGNTSVAFGSSVTRGINSVAFGGSGTSSLPIMSSGLYWDGTQFYAPAIPDSLEVLQRGMLKIVTGSFGTFYLVIDTINFDSTSEKYIFTFSQTLGDWSSFINIVDGITDTNKHITATVSCLTHSAAGNYSLISGVNCQTTLEASCAHAFGQGLIANSPTQTVIGSYNQENSDAKFIIGSGTSDSARKNIFAVTKDNAIEVNGKTVTAPLNSGQMLISTFKNFTETIDAYIGRTDGQATNFVKTDSSHWASPGWYFINYGVIGDSYLENCDPIYAMVPCFPDSVNEPWELTTTWRSGYTSAGSSAKISITITWDILNGFVIKRTIGRDGNGQDKEMIDVQHDCYFSYTGIPMPIDTKFIGRSAYVSPYDPEVGIK